MLDKFHAQAQYDLCEGLLIIVDKAISEVNSTRVKGQLTKENSIRHKDYLKLCVELGNIRYKCVRLIK